LLVSINDSVHKIRPTGQFKWNQLRSYTPYLYIAPFIILLLVFNLYSFARGAWLGMTDAQSINEGSWIGFANYRTIFADRRFWESVVITFKYTIFALLTQVPVAFILAYILNNITNRFRGIVRGIFYVPVLVNTIVTSLVWRKLFDKDVGIINWVLGLLHLPNSFNWLNDSTFCIPLLVIVAFWQWTGYHMVYFLASLQSIDPTIYEVAKLDGASPTRTLVQITVPLMRSAITFVMVTAAIGCLSVFDYPFMLWPNSAPYGPGQQARALVPYIYDFGFGQQFQVGLASAAGWVVFGIIMVVSLFQLRFLGLGNANEE
jgi:cellobiose transport system permease protein